MIHVMRILMVSHAHQASTGAADRPLLRWLTVNGRSVVIDAVTSALACASAWSAAGSAQRLIIRRLDAGLSCLRV